MNETSTNPDRHSHREGDLLSEKHNQYVFRVSPRPTSSRSSAPSSSSSRRLSSTSTPRTYAGKKKRERTRRLRPPPHWKKAIVTLKEGEKTRPRLSTMGLKTFRPLTPARVSRRSRFAEITKDKPEKSLTELTERAAAATTTAASPCVTAAVVTSASIASSTSNAASTTSSPTSSRSNTIRTAPPASRSSSTRTARRPTSSLPSASKGAKVISGPNGIPRSATPFRSSAPARHRHSQHRAHSRPRRPDRSQRRPQAILSNREGGYALVKLPSGEIRKIHEECYATIGQVGNTDHMNVSAARPAAPAGSGVRPTSRHGDEPGRSPDGWWRRQEQGRWRTPASAEPMGPARQGLQDPSQAQGSATASSSRPPQKPKRRTNHGTLTQKRPVRRVEAAR